MIRTLIGTAKTCGCCVIHGLVQSPDGLISPIAWHAAPTSTKHKSLFASFSSEKEESSFVEKKEAKKLLFLRRLAHHAVMRGRAKGA